MGEITNEEADIKKAEILDFILPDKDRYCCRMRMMSYKDIVNDIIHIQKEEK